MGTMSARSAVAGAATVGVLVGVLGSPAAVGTAQDLAERHRLPVTAATFTDIPNWDVFQDGTTADVVWGVVLKLAVLFVVVAVLTALAGRASHHQPRKTPPSMRPTTLPSSWV